VNRRAAKQIRSKILVSGPLIWAVRLGYTARGIVFLIVGGFALLAAGGLGTHPQGARDALELLFQEPLGGYFLWTIAAGLLCFAVWRFLQSILDADDHGGSPYGLMRRASMAASGLFYVALAAATARITIEQRGKTEDQSAREWTAWVMAQPLGRTLIGLIAAGFVVVAIGLAVKAFRTPSGDRLDAPEMARNFATMLGSFGILTRAFVFLMLGCYLGVADYDSDSGMALSLAGLLRAMQHQSYGGIFLGIAALGLLAFGFFEVIEAVARRTHPPRMARPKTARPRKRSAA
jgi:uncharacterized membrane protein YidH (DUF202 family)